MSAPGHAAELSAVASNEAAPTTRRPRAVLATASSIHFVHDGFSDLIYVLLPVWASQFGLTYGPHAQPRWYFGE